MYGDRFGNGRSHDYTALQLDVQHSPSKVKDLHNRCCKGKYWCVKVRPLFSKCQTNYKVVSIITKYCSNFQDVCGIFCAILTWFLILYAEFVVLNVILLPYFSSLYSIVNAILFQCVSILAFSSHL